MRPRNESAGRNARPNSCFVEEHSRRNYPISWAVSNYLHEARRIAKPMVRCQECGADLPASAKFCPACGTQVGLKKETLQVNSERLVEKFNEVARDANVKRVTVKDDRGKVLFSVPLTWGAVSCRDLGISPVACSVGSHRGYSYQMYNRS